MRWLSEHISDVDDNDIQLQNVIASEKKIISAAEDRNFSLSFSEIDGGQLSVIETLNIIIINSLNNDIN